MLLDVKITTWSFNVVAILYSRGALTCWSFISSQTLHRHRKRRDDRREMGGEGGGELRHSGDENWNLSAR